MIADQYARATDNLPCFRAWTDKRRRIGMEAEAQALPFLLLKRAVIGISPATGIRNHDEYGRDHEAGDGGLSDHLIMNLARAGGYSVQQCIQKTIRWISSKL